MRKFAFGASVLLAAVCVGCGPAPWVQITSSVPPGDDGDIHVTAPATVVFGTELGGGCRLETLSWRTSLQPESQDDGLSGERGREFPYTFNTPGRIWVGVSGENGWGVLATDSIWVNVDPAPVVPIPVVVTNFPPVESPPVNPPTPTVDLSFNDQTDMLSWTTTEVTGCTAAGPGNFNGSRPASGAEVIGKNGTYSIVCSGSGGSASDSVTINTFPIPPIACTADKWTCTAWSSCANGTQARSCTHDSSCDTNDGKPAESQSCIVPPVVCTSSDWTCTAWSACANGVQTRTCTHNSGCDTNDGKPPESQSCTNNPPAMVVKITSIASSLLTNNKGGPELNVGDVVRYAVRVHIDNGTGEQLKLHFIPYDVVGVTGMTDAPFTGSTGDHDFNVDDTLGKQTNLETSYFQVLGPTGAPLTGFDGVSVTVFP